MKKKSRKFLELQKNKMNIRTKKIRVSNLMIDTIKKDRPDEWMTIRQVVNYTKLSDQTIRRYVRNGFLKASKRTGRLLFKKSNIDRWLNG